MFTGIKVKKIGPNRKVIKWDDFAFVINLITRHAMMLSLDITCAVVMIFHKNRGIS